MTRRATSITTGRRITECKYRWLQLAAHFVHVVGYIPNEILASDSHTSERTSRCGRGLFRDKE